MTLGRAKAACRFCKKGIGDEFHFTCLACGADYCYIHMTRHGHAPRERARVLEVARQVIRR